MSGSNEKLLGQLFYNKFKDKKVVISMKGTIICNTTAPNQSNKVNDIIAMISTTSKWFLTAPQTFSYRLKYF